MPPFARTTLALLGSLLAGCVGPLSEGEALFDAGHYAAARQALAALEGDSRGWAPGPRAEYALYRGLAHGAVGERARASVWLRRARDLAASSPGALEPDADARLREALTTYEVR